MEIEDDKFKGTTTIGMICKDGVVLASENRATMGNVIAAKNAQKIYKIGDMIGMTTAGGVGDAQQLVQTVSVEANLYRFRTGMKMTIRAMTNMLSRVLVSQKMIPFQVQLLVGGVDREGSHIYMLEGSGARIPETRMTATGSGSPFAFGVLEDRYRDDITTEEAAKLAVRALSNAMRRDAMSGNNITVVVIKKDSYEEMSKEEMQKVLAEMD